MAEKMIKPGYGDDDEWLELDNNELMSEDEQSFEIKEMDGFGEEDSFASDFYRSGSDWSRLLPTATSAGDANCNLDKKLKQTNLLEMWGLKKPKTATPPVLSPPQSKKLKRTSASAINPRESVSTDLGKLANTNKNRTRVCPFYKRIPGTSIAVDAFRYGSIQGCSAYFLSHFHYDHYGGLSKGWSHGPIYCTCVTARLLSLCLSVNSSFITPLEFNTEYVIGGAKITLLEANHCPGAALIHFLIPTGVCYLHTGDFRASQFMQSYSLLINHRVNVLYLDTTYCDPKYKFPSKEDVLNFVVRVTTNFLKRQPKTLVIVGAYSIGKECVYLAISKALGVKIYASASRRRILHSFCWSDLSSALCTEAKDTPLHVLPISSLRFETLKDYLKKYINQYEAVLAFRPTGWTFSESVGKQLDLIKPVSRGNVTIYGVPYSEHSSFPELKDFVQFLKPDRIIPTVNVGNPATRDKMQSYFREWLKG